MGTMGLLRLCRTRLRARVGVSSPAYSTAGFSTGSVTLPYRSCNVIVPSAMAQGAATTEQRVIAGARRAIASGGWQSATLTRIAEEAGVSRMTLHRRGLGRDEIFALLARDYEEAFRAALWPSVTSRGTGAERLRATLDAVCDVTEDHLAFLAALDEEADRRFFHESDEEVHSREGYINPIERLLADGIADGSIREVPIEETATVLVNAVDRTYRHLRRAHDWSEARARAALIDLVLCGLLPDQSV
jgi:AcrR family transcriptional regulator